MGILKGINEEQITMANELIKTLAENGGVMTVYEITLKVLKPNNFNPKRLLQLRDHLEEIALVKYQGEGKYKTILTEKGWEASKVDFMVYLDNL